MAKLIEPTPVLEGKDAERLLNEISSATYNPKKQVFLDECKHIFEQTRK